MPQTLFVLIKTMASLRSDTGAGEKCVTYVTCSEARYTNHAPPDHYYVALVALWLASYMCFSLLFLKGSENHDVPEVDDDSLEFLKQRKRNIYIYI